VEHELEAAGRCPGRACDSAARSGEEVSGEGRDVFARSRRAAGEFDGVEAEEQSARKLPFPLRRGCRRWWRDDADVDARVFEEPTRSISPVSRTRRSLPAAHGHVRDLVEKRVPLRRARSAYALVRASVNAPLTWPKSWTRRCLRKRAGIDGDHGAGGARGEAWRFGRRLLCRCHALR